MQPTRSEYTTRINRVMDFVEQNLDQALPLDTLAKVAGFSPYHFHRIFSAMVGEPLNQYVQRLRVEKAATMLLREPKTSITEIAFNCGFSGSATFARVFRDTFGMSASQWRLGGYASFTRNPADNLKERLLSGPDQNIDLLPMRLDPVTRTPKWTVRIPGHETVDIEVKRIPDLTLAYVRHMGPYAGMAEVFAALFDKLMRWAAPRGLLADPQLQVLAVYHDDPCVTDETRLRVDACITVPVNTRADGEVGCTTLPGGSCAVGRFALGDKDYPEAWYTMMGVWLPESGYQPDDRLCYERFHDDEERKKQGKCLVDICIPVKAL